MKQALIIENDTSLYPRLAKLLDSQGYKATHATSIKQAQSFLRNSAKGSAAQEQDTQSPNLPFDLIISELQLPDAPAIDLVADASCPLLVLCAASDSASMLDVMRAGATDCIINPYKDSDLISALARLNPEPQACSSADKRGSASVTSKASTSEAPASETKAAEICEQAPVPGMIGTSPSMQTVYLRIRKAAPTRSTILIRGETGTGKELVARAVHGASDRAEQPFIAVNCAAIPETLIEAELFGHEKGAFTGAASKRSGLIEAAEGGTLFLDEIGELPSEAQARLLRFIQESEIRRIGSNESHRVNVRLIAATHRDLKKLTTSGGFRPDLYYRINVVRIDLPPLKQRGNDLLEIAQHLLERAANRHDKPGLHLLPEAIQTINNYSWPGNVRELENVIERAAIMTEGLEIDRDALEIDVEFGDNARFNAEILTPFTGNYLEINQPSVSNMSGAGINSLGTSAASSRNQLPDPIEDLSLEDYFQRFVLENQETMNETELAKKLGISRKCLWERRQRFGIPRNKTGGKSSSGGLL